MKIGQLKRKIFYLATTVLILVLVFAAWGFLIEPNRLVVKQQNISLPNWRGNLQGLRVAVVSDIHAGSPYVGLDKINLVVSTINGAKPDLIVLLGDFMITKSFFKKPIEPELFAVALKSLQAPHGVYAVLGNHDWWYNGNRVRRALDEVGIKVLENEVVAIDLDGEPLWLAGLADAWTRPQNVPGTLKAVPQGQSVLVITHNPDVFPLLPVNVGLTLAGHTHGGQVSLPIVGRLVVPSQHRQRYAAGLVVENEKRLFVTTGIGTSILPIRFRVPPEIVILTLQSN